MRRNAKMQFGRKVLIAVTFTCILQKAPVLTQDYAEESVFQKCNQTIKEGHGVIMSPNFTTTYPNNLHCRWTIVVEPERTVTLTFGYFDIEGGRNCQYDKVSVYNGPTTSHPMSGHFCGPFRPGQQASTSNKMLVTMDTDASNKRDRRGFYAVFLSASPTLATEGSCGGLLTGLEGSFHSPQYPKSDYPPSVTCSWHIRAENDRVIHLSFKEFEIEKSDGCKYDSVVIIAGWTFSEKTKFIGRFCGGITDLPFTITSPGNELFITFISDASGFGKGFLASYATKEEPRKYSAEEDFSSVLPKTTVTTSTVRQITTTVTTTTTPFRCPFRCPTKIKLKTRLCTADYVVVVKISDVKALRADGNSAAQVVKAFKLGSLPSTTEINVRIACQRCNSVFKAGSYLIAGDAVAPNGLVIRPGDFVVRYKERKHTKQVERFGKRCSAKRNPRKKRAGRKRKRESSVNRH